MSWGESSHFLIFLAAPHAKCPIGIIETWHVLTANCTSQLATSLGGWTVTPYQWPHLTQISRHVLQRNFLRALCAIHKLDDLISKSCSAGTYTKKSSQLQGMVAEPWILHQLNLILSKRFIHKHIQVLHHIYVRVKTWYLLLLKSPKNLPVLYRYV